MSEENRLQYKYGSKAEAKEQRDYFSKNNTLLVSQRFLALTLFPFYQIIYAYLINLSAEC